MDAFIGDFLLKIVDFYVQVVAWNECKLQTLVVQPLLFLAPYAHLFAMWTIPVEAIKLPLSAVVSFEFELSIFTWWSKLIVVFFCALMMRQDLLVCLSVFVETIKACEHLYISRVIFELPINEPLYAESKS